MTRFVTKILMCFFAFFFCVFTLNAQISAPGSINKIETLDHDIYVFCASKDNASLGTLTATAPMRVNSTFVWEKLDTLSGSFVPANGFISFEDTLSSTISRLENGLYRVTINASGNVSTGFAYVLNYWIEVASAEIPDSTSTCDGFQLTGSYNKAPLYYYDKENKRHDLNTLYGRVSVKWFKGAEWVFSSLEPYSDPIASDDPIEYKLVVTNDEFGCDDEATIEYFSKIPKSDFSADPMTGEAVLKVTFDNKSINYDSTLWFFYKSKLDIQKEITENEGDVVDSVDFVLFDDAPVYEYERSGDYLVKLVTVKINSTTGNCYDTLHMETGIVVDTSFIKAPNVFTPNGDGKNDNFVVRSNSLKSMTIKIYNRWGGLVHSWSYSNIRGRDYTYEHSVWDGRVNGGRMASPGVYFYVVRAVGRDGKKRNEDGFIHLFRNKN